MSPLIRRGSALLMVTLLVAVCSGCSEDCQVCPPLTEVKTDFISVEKGPYYLTWTHGDAEFGGAPEVYFTARAYVRGVDSLMCCASMTAVEVGGDGTAGRAVVDVCVWVAPNGWEITNVDWDPCDIWRFIESGTGSHHVTCNNTSTWAFDFVGDTAGADVCGDVDCTKFRFTFIATVEYQKL